MKTTNNPPIKFSLYLDKELKNRIDVAYKTYCERLAAETELKCKPISLSSWLESILNNSKLIGEASR